MLKDRLRYEDGSSPLTRGKHGFVVSERVDPGLIPAHAGKTLTCGRRSTSWTAHPRSRGENVASRDWPLIVAGSSPLTRGKLAAEGLDRRAARLIPAHAGKTRAGKAHRHLDPAHPRSRGENDRLRKARESAGGSSPLTRGKQEIKQCLTKLFRLIPAHAGKTRA